MTFDDWLGRAWNDHADNAAAVADRLDQGLGLAGNAGEASRLAHLAHHVVGQHLARWHECRAFLQALQPRVQADAASAQALARFLASLAYVTGGDPAVADASERVRALAMAAASLSVHEGARAASLFQRALTEAETHRLPDTDPYVRSLAAAGNNIAASLEELPERGIAERELMILAAQTALRCWSLAGTWLETERAHYRLAHSWLKAGDTNRAREHAQHCLDIVQAQGNVPLEAFFGNEALYLAEQAAGNAAGQARARAQAQSAFEGLGESDKSWCRATLDKLAV